MASNQLESVLQIPMFTIYGLVVSNNATTPNTKVDISAGICRDDQNNINMVLGSLFPSASNQTFTAPITVDATVNGANGLDAGSLAASSVYAVYLIGDSRGYKTPAGLLSLASNANPTMPFDYDSKRLIGYAITDAAVHFLKFQLFGLGSNRRFVFDAPQATAVTAGAATTYTGVVLTTLVPPVNNTPVFVSTALTPAVAGHGVFLQSFNAAGDQVVKLGQVAAVVLDNTDTVLAQLNVAAPSIKYKVSNAADAVAINVAGFEFSL